MNKDIEHFANRVELESREDGVQLIRLHGTEGKGIFVFDLAGMEALETAVSRVEERPKSRALVAIGGKDGFVAGADVNVIAGIRDEAAARELSERGQACFARIAALPFVTVAAIDGPCLGGGCELALAFDYRVATRSKKTRIGLPEVQLGILPGFGGTQRLPRLVGLPTALDLMLKGSRLDSNRARKRGLVDRVVPDVKLFDAALELAVSHPKPRRKLGLRDRILTFTGFGRAMVRKSVTKTLEKGMARFLIAPRRLLAVTLAGLKAGRQGAYDLEAQALAELAVGSQCKHFLRLFFASEDARKLHRKLDPEAKAVGSAVVVGGGVMGAGIAGHFATRGIRTRLVDLSADALASAAKRLAKALQKRLSRRRIKKHEAQAARDRFEPSQKLVGFAGRDLVLEAVAENLDLKREIFGQAAEQISDEAILATNTSSLPLAEIGRDLPHPENLVGLHFFNPPEKMPLVEIIRHDRSSNRALARAARLATDLGKFPVLVKDGPGFLVNRCLAPYLAQAVAMFEEGTPPERIDRIAEEFGMPMGPMHLLDQIGWDVAATVCDVIGGAFPERMRPSALFGLMSDEGLLGCKAGEGVYTYGKKGKQGPSERCRKLLRDRGLAGANDQSDQSARGDGEILDRLLLPMVNEAWVCLEEAVVGCEEDLDLAMIMGIGFPPHRGGLCRWAREQGLGSLARRMSALAERRGAELGASPALARAGGQVTVKHEAESDEPSPSDGASEAGCEEAEREQPSC